MLLWRVLHRCMERPAAVTSVLAALCRRVLQSPDMELIMRYREMPCPGCGGMEE